jgi:formamidopyrimidine-DNA glycosylase
MEGRFYVKSIDEPMHKHSHVLIQLNEGVRVEYNDTRKFGRFYYYDSEDDLAVLKHLGPEPFDPALTSETLFRATRNKKTVLKVWLLDQTHIAGIGNIYADEICFASHMSPRQLVGRISRKQWDDILNHIREILTLAIEAGGTTIRTYTSSLGISGRFQVTLNAYGRNNKPCFICGTPMKRIVVGQRGTVYCPVCQKVR